MWRITTESTQRREHTKIEEWAHRSLEWHHLETPGVDSRSSQNPVSKHASTQAHLAARFQRGKFRHTNACASMCGLWNLCPMISSIASTVPGCSRAVTSGGGANALRAKSDHRSTLGTAMRRAFDALRAVSLPPVTYAAPMIASTTSAIAWRT